MNLGQPPCDGGYVAPPEDVDHAEWNERQQRLNEHLVFHTPAAQAPRVRALLRRVIPWLRAEFDGTGSRWSGNTTRNGS